MELINGNLKIAKSLIHGWGLFTNEFIKQDQIICQSVGIFFPPFIEYPKEIFNYLYNSHSPKGLLLFLGYSSLINSSETPNSNFKIDFEQYIITITSIKNINPLEEITLNYIN